MNCNESQSLILEELFGELNPAHKKDLKEHLKACTACSKEYDQHRQTLNLCASLPLHSPPESITRTVVNEAAKAVEAAKAMEATKAVAGRRIIVTDTSKRKVWFDFSFWRVAVPLASLAAIILAAVITPFLMGGDRLDNVQETSSSLAKVQKRGFTKSATGAKSAPVAVADISLKSEEDAFDEGLAVEDTPAENTAAEGMAAADRELKAYPAAAATLVSDDGDTVHEPSPVVVADSGLGMGVPPEVMEEESSFKDALLPTQPTGMAVSAPAAPSSSGPADAAVAADEEFTLSDVAFSRTEPVVLTEIPQLQQFIQVAESRPPRSSMPQVRRRSVQKRPGRSSQPVTTADWSADRSRYEQPSAGQSLSAVNVPGLILIEAERMESEGFLTQAAGLYHFFLINYPESARAPDVWRSLVTCLLEAGEFQAAQKNDAILRERLPALARNVPPFTELLKDSLKNE